MTAMMRAAQFHSYGPPDVIVTGTAPVPAPRASEVLIRVGATSIDGAEPLLRAGGLRPLSGRRFPKGLGMDFAGEIAALGDRVHDVAIGDHVWGVLDMKAMLSQLPTGSAADYVVVAASRVALVPAGLSSSDAVALIGGTTAMTALLDKAHLRPAERLLVRGGTGGVGFVGLQLGHALGAHVTALVSAPNLETARQLGADVALDYRATGPEDLGEFDVIFDTVGTQMGRYRNRLARGGRMVSISFNPVARGLATIAVSVIHGSRRIRTFSGNPTRALLDDYSTYITAGQVHAMIAGTYELEDLAAAHRAAEAGGSPGKHVITLH
jgi:NADPH:quinone reductase-like Zn-dependent oxidoreductase